VARQNRSDGSYEERSKVSIERNPIEDLLVGGESEMSSLVDESEMSSLVDGETSKNEGIRSYQKVMKALRDEEIQRHLKAMKTSEKDEEIKLLKHQLYEKDEEIRRHQKAMKTICSDLKFALEAAEELRQQENPWLNENITGFMFYNLENAHATAQFGERNQPYSWRGNWDLVGAVMS
jgi:hypothetical protein